MSSVLATATNHPGVLLVNYRGLRPYGCTVPAVRRSGSVLILGCMSACGIEDPNSQIHTLWLSGQGFEACLAKEPYAWSAAERRMSPLVRRGALQLPVGWDRLVRAETGAPIVVSREPFALTGSRRDLSGALEVVTDGAGQLREVLDKALRHIGLEGLELLKMRDRLLLQTLAGVRRFGL